MLFLAAAAALFVWAIVRFEAVADLVVSVVLIAAALILVLVMVLVVGIVVLHRVAERDAARREVYARTSRGRRPTGLGRRAERGPDHDPVEVLAGAQDRLFEAADPEHLLAEVDEGRPLTAVGHVIRLYLRGPDRDQVRRIHADVNEAIESLADQVADTEPAGADVLRSLAEPTFRPSRSEWRRLLDAEDVPILVAVAVRTLLRRRRWREASTIFYKTSLGALALVDFR
ncbi:hypothetical protein [Actinomycetospora termitidis]|uniref:Uncharacterized protein n=1 Tax=Actinomycetospora termitidis TaxID=3053470 RepID=A0ABT7M7B5_9PSEU|nr:hypothetical protein [Actinomycetospora sp. Odt1-22]MDL5156561.1 hypothetical protein [Actinomycetospora sp. Odt1-22]